MVNLKEFEGKNVEFVSSWLKSKGLETLVDVFESKYFTSYVKHLFLKMRTEWLI
jgi:hypothetical protein